MNFRKLITYLTMGTAAAMPLAVAQNPTILQGNYITNVFGNSNFVLNPNALTNVANVTNATRSTTTPLVATSEFTLSLASGANATWTLRAFDGGMKGQNCEARFTYRGFATATTKAEIVQNSLVVASLTLTPTTDPRIASINFPCGDLVNATTFRIAQTTANMTGTNEIGGIYVGLATNMANVAQAETVLMATRTTNQSIPNVTETTVVYATEELDVYGEYDSSTGVFTAKRAGRYFVAAQTLINAATGWAFSEVHDLKIFKNNNSIASNRVEVEVTPTSAPYMWNQVNATIELAIGDSIKVTMYQSNGATLDILAGGQYNRLQISRFPSSSELVVTPERQNVFGGVSYAGNTDFSGTSATVASVTDSNFGARTFHGGASLAGTACGLTANDFGFCMTNVPPGTYQIAGNVEVGSIETGTDKSYCNYKVRVGGTSLSDTEVINAIPHSNAQNNFSTLGTGIIKITAFQPNLRVWMSYNKDSLADQCNVRSTTSALSSALPSLQISPLDQPSNSALYVEGPVKASATGAAIPAGYVGEKITFTSRTISAVTTGWTANANALATLTPGVWLVQTSLTCQNTINSTGCGGFIATGTNNAPDQFLTSSADTTYSYDVNFGGVYQMISIVYATSGSQAIYAKAIAYGANRNVAIGGYAIRLN